MYTPLGMVQVKLDQIHFEEKIYPRKQMSQKTVESYIESLKGGAQFPPIELQKVKYPDGKEKNIILDGMHRFSAYKEYDSVEEIPATFYKPDNVLDLEADREELLTRSTSLNTKHGDRLPLSDLGEVVLKIIKLRTKDRIHGIVNELAKQFGYDQSTISQLPTSEGKVSVVLKKIEGSRDFKIWALNQLGWGPTDIERYFNFGINRPTISKIVQNIGDNILNDIKAQYDKGKSVSDIAEFESAPEAVLWAMILHDEKDDVKRFEEFGESDYQDDTPKVYNHWNFKAVDPRLGQDHPGRIPGQIVMNVLYYYTKLGDRVVDPMAGGGSTLDACLIMGRKCKAYDVEPRRDDIVQHDISKGFPEDIGKCDLIFLDPPYGNIMARQYSKESISSASLDDFNKFMKDTARHCESLLNKSGHVALLMEALVDEIDTKDFIDFPFLCVRAFESAGFKEVQRIGVPVSSEVKSALDVDRFKQRKQMLNLNRDLIIFDKS